MLFSLMRTSLGVNFDPISLVTQRPGLMGNPLMSGRESAKELPIRLAERFRANGPCPPRRAGLVPGCIRGPAIPLPKRPADEAVSLG